MTAGVYFKNNGSDITHCEGPGAGAAENNQQMAQKHF